MQNQSVTITRRQVSQWASIIGGVALLIGLVGLIWQGGVTPLILVTLVLGVAGITLWGLLSPAEFRNLITGRQARFGTVTLFSTLLLIGIVAQLYVVMQRAVITLDMTEGQRFTISGESRGVLRRITRPIQITGFYSPRALQQREVDDQFFRAYEAEAAGMIRRRFIDPDQEPAVAQRFNVTYDGQVFISYLTQDGSVDFDTLARVPSSENQERDLTQAIARLLIAGTVRVYFERGLDTLDPLDGEQGGLAGINNGIRESGLVTAPLSLPDLAAAGNDVPQDASAVIFARPLRDLSSAEIAVLDRYLQRGGALFIMTDVLFNDNAFLRESGDFNRYLESNFGLRALDAAVVDPASSSETPLDVISAAVFPENEIARRIDEQNAPTLFRLVRAIDVSATLPSGVSNGRVIMSSETSYGERDLRTLSLTNQTTFDPSTDLAGPLTMVAWAYNRNTGAKILVVGDSDFATNGQILSGGNSLLFTDGLSWLTGFSDRINFSPQAYASGLPVMFVSGQMLDVIAFLTVILLPGIVLATGLIVWNRRIRR